MSITQRRYAPLAPAKPRAPPPPEPRVTFYDLPAELRIEIYKLALENVVIHILPLPSATSTNNKQAPHGLTRTSRQVRNEVLPLMHSTCPIRCAITDWNFEGILHWLKRIPPDEQSKLCKNQSLTIRFNTTGTSPPKSIHSLQIWLRIRADKCRPQPKWQYTGVTPHSKICADLRRRAKRMTEAGKQNEFWAILRSLSIPCGDDARGNNSRLQS